MGFSKISSHVFEGGDHVQCETKGAARRNVKKAVAAAKSKKTISHLSKSTSMALGKQGAKLRERRRTHA
jgi:hypothetical protein